MVNKTGYYIFSAEGCLGEVLQLSLKLYVIGSQLHTDSLYLFTWQLLKSSSFTSHWRMSPSGSRTESKFSFQNEVWPHLPQVSCKGGTSLFRYGIRHVDWLRWSTDSYFWPADVLNALSFQNENFYVSLEWNMCIVPEWNSFRYHVKTT